jgi:hypothetical protein
VGIRAGVDPTDLGGGSTGFEVGDGLGIQPLTAKTRNATKRISERSLFIFIPLFYVILLSNNTQNIGDVEENGLWSGII